MTLYKDSLQLLSERDFYRFVEKDYPVSPYECDELKDSRFCEGTYYPCICKTRFFMTYKALGRHLHLDSRILDLGLYPGTLVRQLKMLFKEKIECYGLGHQRDKGFSEYISSYVSRYVDVELDPFYLRSEERNVRVPFADGYFDGVIATELLEHLISPIEMIREAARILKTNGIFILTTPNVSHIGAVFKLIMGKSNHERLDRSPMCLQEDVWRGHIRFYDKKELVTLFQRHGLELIDHRYYLERGWDHAKWPLVKRAIIRAVDFLTPLYRESHFAIFKKIS